MLRHTLAALSLTLLPIPASADDAAPPSADAPVSQGLEWMPRDGDEISFDVLRKGKPFGTHTVSFDVTGDGTVKATTDVRLKAGLGPITLFRYELQAVETWQNGRLVALNGAVDDDGNDGSVRAVRDGQALDITGTEYSGEVPLGIFPASHWNVAQTRASQLLSTEDGELIRVNVIDKGPDTVTVAGQTVEANHYLMDSDIDVDLWYDEQGRWVKLGFTARGQRIEYVLTRSY